MLPGIFEIIKKRMAEATKSPDKPVAPGNRSVCRITTAKSACVNRVAETPG